MFTEKDLFKSPNGLYPVVLNGQIGTNQPGEVCGFSLEETLRLVNGKFVKGPLKDQPWARVWKPEPKK